MAVVSDAPDQALLETALQALNIGRDNKALLVARDGIIIDVNKLASELCGEDLVGKRVFPELFDHEPSLPHAVEIRRWVTAMRTGTGGYLDVEVVRQPLAMRLPGVQVYAVRDLRERHKIAEDGERQQKSLAQRDDELRAQNLRFQMALTSLSVGLCVFDAEQRLVICNEPYLFMYSLSPDLVKPGITLREILQQRVDEGLYSGTSAEAFIRERLDIVAAHRSSRATHCFPDGRIIEVGHHPIPGGGWVATHEDVTERRRVETALARSNSELEGQNRRFDTAMNNISQGLCFFDGDQRLIVCNQRYIEMYRLPKEHVRPGITLREIVQHRFTAGSCPEMTAEQYLAWRDNVAVSSKPSDSTVKLKDGRTFAIHHEPMPDGGWVATHQDITESERLNARLVQQHEQLDIALENMLQGVAMFDAEQGLIVCNERYADMYGLSPEQVRPGTTVRQILEHRFASGFYHGSDKESFVSSWTGTFGEVSSRIQELADGRIINVTRRSMANGGRLVTHEDITERQRLNAQLQQQHQLLKEQEEQLRQQNVRLDAALTNMVQGLAMFDSEHRVVIANDRYAAMYGLTPDEVRPGTTLRQIHEFRIAKGYCPGRNADDMLRATLRRMSATDLTQYAAKLEDGRCISVTARAMPDGGTVTTHHDITEQRRSEAKIAHMALHDALTGLPNRVLLNERLEHGIARVKRGEIVAIHFLDLDHFKTVNDTLGHPTGDKLLQMVADRLRDLVREVDTVARMGGDEFAIVQVGIAEPADATSLALRVIDAISATYEIEGHQVVIGASVGIAIGPSDGQKPEQLMRNADLALYRAKGDGRGTFRFFERDMDAQMQERHVLDRDLRKALPAGQFELYYQPVVELASNDISGFEALIRWWHPERGLILPDTFIPLAEEIGLIVPIGEWIIREACATAAKWPEDLKIAVNLSPVQFRSPGLLQVVIGALAASGLAADRLELEITETVLLQDGEATLNLLYKLRELGIRIAMDDFGTGYSSLSYLQSFPFDKIKIDRSFVKDIVESTGSLNIVRAISTLARGLGMAATAEGVETQEQLETIRSEGCTEMQGYLFSQALPAAEIERLFISKRITGRKRTSLG